MLSVIMLSVIMLSVIKLSVIMPNAVTPNVVAPTNTGVYLASALVMKKNLYIIDICEVFWEVGRVHKT
jgi:hypothetical protein